MDSDRFEGRIVVDRDEDGLERAVRVALQRVDAPDGFAERVLARAAERGVRASDSRRVSAIRRFTTPVWRLVYAAAALIAITAGTVHVERARVEQRRADVAAAQFSQAMDVTNRTLEKVSVRLQQGEIGQLTKVLEGN